MDKAKIKDYLTTLAFFGVSSVVAYQAQLMNYVPIEYSMMALIGFGILSQVAADARVKEKVAEAQAEIDQAQITIAAHKEEVEEAYNRVNAKVDEVQTKVEEEGMA